jgi:hypothetical protein
VSDRSERLALRLLLRRAGSVGVEAQPSGQTRPVSDPRRADPEAKMTVFEFRMTMAEAELLDASEGVVELLDRRDDLDLPSPLADLLLTLDEAITEAVAQTRLRRRWRTRYAAVVGGLSRFTH